MRRFLILLALGLFAGSLGGCGGGDKPAPGVGVPAPQPPGEPKDGP